MSCVAWVRRTLEDEGAAFEERHHPLAYTAQQVAEREHISGHRVAKVVVAIADERMVALVLPATRKVSLEQLRETLPANRIRLASEEEMARAFPDCEVGALPPLLHYPDLEVIMDRSMEVDGDILFQGGTHCDAVRMRFDDWYRSVRPRVESFSHPTETTWPW